MLKHNNIIYMARPLHLCESLGLVIMKLLF